MEYIKVAMILERLDQLPYHPLPEGYQLRNFREGDEDTWSEIETSVDEFKSVDKASEHFHEEFGPYIDEMKIRCFFIDTAGGRSIGTATAWYNRDFRDGTYGRLHWVGIHPDLQGKKLGKPLTSAAMDRLAQYHKKAYLTTQTTSFIAIKIYLDFGFEPYLTMDSCPKAWQLLAKKLKHPALNDYL